MDRHLWLILLVAAFIVIPRTLLVAHAHNETVDEEYHVLRGLRALYLALDGVKLNDPPTGEALITLPYRLLGLQPTEPSVLHGQPVAVETLRLLVAGWKAVLFLPFVAVVFVWVRKLYGLASAWMAAMLLCVDPTFAGHLAPATLDVLGVEGIVIACFTWWRYFEAPTIGRAMVASVLAALAMTFKHTAIILPAVVLLMSACFWIGRRRDQLLGRSLRHAGISIVTGFIVITLLSGGIRRPTIAPDWQNSHPKLASMLGRPLPAGWYVGSIANADDHGDRGHRALLLGQRSDRGWWTYFPIVATYKVPIPFFGLALLAIASCHRRRIAFAEIGLLLPMGCFAVFIAQSGINIGFRHILPTYAFILMWVGGRSMLLPGWGWWASIALATAGACHGLLWHPNYLSYINWPRRHVWTQINDSNIDWGQGLMQARQWIDARPPDGKPIYLNYFGKAPYRYYLGDRVQLSNAFDPLPEHGLLIIAPTRLMGIYDNMKTYRYVRATEPIAIIGDSMPVFDLDAYTQWIRKRKPATRPATEPGG